MSIGAPLIELSHAARHYQSGDTIIRAIDDISLAIHHGEFVAIMGPSGCGKSTLMNILGCLDKPTSGTYRINGNDVANLDGNALATLRRETFGFIFQRYNLLTNATASENVEVPAVYAGMSATERRTRAQTLLERLGIGTRGAHRPTQLSGGQQQRVAIARALMNDPLAILADEPTGALDSRSGIEVMALLKEIHATGRTIILITHDQTVAAHAQRIISLQDGKILHDNNKAEFHPAFLNHDKKLQTTVQSNNNAVNQIIESVHIALRALKANFFRTALTLLGIIIGVAAVVAMLAVGQGSKEKVLSQISSLGTNILNIRPGAPGMRPTGDVVTLTVSDALAITSIPNITAVVPERSGRKTLRYGSQDYASSVQGVGRSFTTARDWPLARGNFFNERDEKSYAAVTVLGKTASQALFPNGIDPIGKYILIGTIPFEVIGVLEAKGAAPWGGDQDDTALVPYTTSMIRLFGSTHLNSITVKVADSGLIESTQQSIKDMLLARHKTEDFQIRNTASFLATATATQDTLTILLGTIAAISLLVGGIGVMNIMLVSVMERTREIGVRMATGARASDIMIQFITEAAVVCIIGGLLGVALGFGVGFAASAFNVSVIFQPMPAIVAFSSAVLTGVIFGYLPARKAARLDPVIALSSE